MINGLNFIFDESDPWLDVTTDFEKSLMELPKGENDDDFVVNEENTWLQFDITDIMTKTNQTNLRDDDEAKKSAFDTDSLIDHFSVLVVDDSLISRKITQSKLTGVFNDQKWKVYAAENGEIALADVLRFQESGCTLKADHKDVSNFNRQSRVCDTSSGSKSKKIPDVIIIDQNMSSTGGRMLGHEVVQRIRSFAELQNIIIIGCTGNPEFSTMPLLEAGCDAVWAKPMPCQAEAMNQIFELRLLKQGGLLSIHFPCITENLISRQISIQLKNRQHSAFKRERARKTRLLDVDTRSAVKDDIMDTCSIPSLECPPPLQKCRSLRIENSENPGLVLSTLPLHQNFVIPRTYDDLREICKRLVEDAECDEDDDNSDDSDDSNSDDDSGSDDDSTVSSLTSCSHSITSGSGDCALDQIKVE